MSNLNYAITLKFIDKLSAPAHKCIAKMEKSTRKLEKGVAKTDKAFARQTRTVNKTGYAGKTASDKLVRGQAKVRSATNRTTKAVQKQQKAQKKLGKLIGGVVGGAVVVGAGKRALGASVNQMRLTERSKGDLQSLGMQDTSAITDRGRELQGKYADISVSEFTSAAYDIKSGISSLSDKGVADMTAYAALTAKATKGEVGQMTGLFATGYGTFKDTLHKGLSDAEFGEKLSAGLAASVQAFKTTGGDMQTAMQSAGSGLSNVNISMESQFAAMGMLQQKMEAGVAGTTLKALEKSIVKADKKIKGVSLVGDDGNMRNLPALLISLEKKYGDKYTSKTGAELQSAFGSEEAVKFFSALWGQGEALRNNTKLLKGATSKGIATTEGMAQARDDNWDSRLKITGQKIALLGERIGYALTPHLEKILPIVDGVVDGITSFVDGNSGIASIGIAVLAIGVPIATTVGSFKLLSRAIRRLGNQAAMSGAGMLGGAGKNKNKRKTKARGKAGKAFNLLAKGAGLVTAGVFAKEALTQPKAAATNAVVEKSKALEKRQAKAAAPKASTLPASLTVKPSTLKGLTKRIPFLGALFTASDMAITVTDNSINKDDKTRELFKSFFGGVGGAAGGAAGATVGSVVPVAGTVIGGVAGGVAGYEAGEWAGDKLASAYLTAGDAINGVTAKIGASWDSIGGFFSSFNAATSGRDNYSTQAKLADIKPVQVVSSEKTEIKVPERKVEQKNNITVNVTGYTDGQLVNKVMQIIKSEMAKSATALKSASENITVDINPQAVD